MKWFLISVALLQFGASLGLLTIGSILTHDVYEASILRPTFSNYLFYNILFAMLISPLLFLSAVLTFTAIFTKFTKRNYYTVFAYSHFAFVAFAILLTFIFTNNHGFDLETKAGVKFPFDKLAEDPSWPLIQSRYRCCGFRNYQDWQKRLKSIPEKCCQLPFPECSNSLENIFKDGCLEAFRIHVEFWFRFIVGGLILSLITLFLGMICSLIIIRKSSRNAQ